MIYRFYCGADDDVIRYGVVKLFTDTRASHDPVSADECRKVEHTARFGLRAHSERSGNPARRGTLLRACSCSTCSVTSYELAEHTGGPVAYQQASRIRWSPKELKLSLSQASIPLRYN